jgi:DNA-binding NarL/FixJ family response regulator
MPEKRGDEVLKEIRQIDPFVEVIVYTAGGMHSNELELIKTLSNLGIDGYVNKGSEANLQELIDKIMSKLAPVDEDGLAMLLQHSPGLNDL